MKVDDWVQIEDTGEVGVVAAIGELIVVRVARADSPFPKYVGTSGKNVKRYTPQQDEPQIERALL